MAKNTVKNKINLDENVTWFAEKTNELNKKSRQRDRESEIDIEKVNKEEKKANETGHTIVKIKHKNKAPFSMFISDNLSYLIYKKEYLKSNERAFLLDISPCIQLNSNILVDVTYDGNKNIFSQTNDFIDISRLAMILKATSRQLRTTIKSLVEKGILFEYLTSKHIQQIKRSGNIKSERMLIVNPEILFKGDKNHIETGLCSITLNNDILEQNNILLPWKIWRDINAQEGKLYRRDTYLKKKKELEEQRKNKVKNKSKKV